MQKRICILLALLLALPLTGCGEETATTDTKDTTEDTQTVTDTTETENEGKDDLPSDLHYGGADFAFHTREKPYFHGNINVEESTGEQLNDALYNRARFVEERLGVVFTETMDEDGNDKVKAMILAGDTTYKVITARNSETVHNAAEGLVRPMDTLTYVDLTKPYWDDSINSCLTIAGTAFTAVGSYNLPSYDFTHALLFNKDMATDLALESPYEMVKEGRWTFDAFRQFGSTAIADTDGNGTFDLNDRYGYVAGAKQIPSSFWISAGVQGIYKDENDIPQFTLGADEKFMDVLLSVYEVIWDTGMWYVYTPADNMPQSSIDLFSQNQALLMDVTFYYVESFREMEADFGILPYPKYDEEQDKYYSRIEAGELPYVPVILSDADADMAGAVLEALASYSYQYVIPVYYDTYLKSKNTRDEESAEMLDILFENRVFDLSDTIWCDQIRDAFIYRSFSSNNRNLASQIAASTKSIQENIDSVVAGFTKE